MPRTTRSASAKPDSKPPTKVAPKVAPKATIRANSRPPKKRAASPERCVSPMPKRRRTGNSLPTPPEKSRPGLQLFVWGAGNFGQFGMGPAVLDEIQKPRKNAWVEQKIADDTFGLDNGGLETIAAGGLHTIFVDENGTVWSCGVNDDAALGRITQNVPDPDNPGKFMDIDLLTSYPHPLQTLIDEEFRAVKITAGDSISAAISAKGELRVWGSFRANEGSLGFSSGLKHQFLPTPILTLGDTEKVVSIAAGSNHLLVLTTFGNLYTWGAGEQSQLGRKVIERRKIHGTVPEKILLGARSRKAVTIGSGHYHSFAVDDQGVVWGWGLNSMGQTGTGYSQSADSEVVYPKRIAGLSPDKLGGERVVEIVGGDHHSLFRTSGGKVYACGRSNASQLGLPDDHPAFKDRDYPDFVSEPVRVPFPDESDPIVQISAGIHNNMAVSMGGALYAWGQGIQSELGTGDESEVKTPKMIVRKEGGSWKAVTVACGGQHTLGLFRKKN